MASDMATSSVATSARASGVRKPSPSGKPPASRMAPFRSRAHTCSMRRKPAESRGDVARGIVFDAKGQTVAEFLTRWLEDVVKPNKTHRTYATHRQQVHSHIIPSIGRV